MNNGSFVIKRSGKKVPFDGEKVYQAIFKAGAETKEFDEKRARKLTTKVIMCLDDMFSASESTPTVEDVQDVVETVLMHSTYKETAKVYILYREARAQVRDFSKSLDLIDAYVGKTDWLLKENASSSFSLQGMNNYVSSALVSRYWLDRIYPKTIRNLHDAGDIHIHDLSSLSAYCVGWDLYDLLQIGFRGLHSGKVDAGPAKHFSAALGQMFNFMYTLQGEAAGAQAFSNVDTLLAPLVAKDALTYEKVKQELQQFIFNMNVPTRVGFQQPFTNLTFDLIPSPIYKDQCVIIGGEPYGDHTYGEFQKEMTMINKAFCEIMCEGDYSGRPFSFPIPTYNITEDFDWNNSELISLWEMTGKFGVPYFANFIGSDMDPSDARSMCCRLRLDGSKLSKRMGGMFGSAPLTGSIGVVTINLPRIAYKTKTVEDFKIRLEDLFKLSVESLSIKRKVVEDLTDKGLYPYSRFYLRAIKERTDKYWTNHFETVGVVGMNEACLNLFGEDISTEKGLLFSKDILSFLKNLVEDHNDKTDGLCNLEATPAEGVCYRLAKLDKETYPKIITAGDDVPYYTNSTFLPVNKTNDLFEALTHQEQIQTYYTGGTVFHAFLGESIPSTNLVRDLIKKITQGFKLPYITLTPTFSICPDHGVFNGEFFECPVCKKEIEVFSRVVGYYRPISRWNPGKQEEFKDRLPYSIKE